MAVYSYKALDANQTAVSGVIAGDSPRQARDQLRGQGLTVREIREEVPQTRNEFNRFFAFGWPQNYQAKVAAMAGELSTLLSVGVPLSDALNTLIQQYRGPFKTSILMLRDQIQAGSSVAEAMSQQPQVFDALTINMVEVGESSGNLETVLRRLAEFKQKSLEFKDRVILALTYPAIVLTVSIGVSIFLMTFVVPMLLSNLEEAGRTLPWPTMVLKFLSDILLRYGLWLLAGLVIGFVGLIVLMRTKAGRRAWYRLLIRLPVIGSMALKQEIARVAMVISTLLGSGIVFLKAVEIAGRSTRNVLIHDALIDCAERINAGRDMGEAMERANFFPPLVVHVFSVGQKSGKLEEMLLRLAEDYDRQVSSASARFSAVIEPILILLLAIFVGFILFATMLPILEAGNVL
ncbi:MAG: type II secretion system F family protein [Pirellulaceae bacterium]